MNLLHPFNYGFFVTIGAVATFFIIEALKLFFHQRRLHTIPVRIHINGSRGKSSVTRLVGAVMRATGKITVTKTTGTAARFILPDGYEIPIFRAGKPNITEQIKVVKKAHEFKAQVLVAECMAVTPEYIHILQTKTIQGTLGIFTNVRDDHLDVMGPTIHHAAINMAKSMPTNGHVITAEKPFFPELEQEAKKRKSTIAQAIGITVSDDEMNGFDYIEHKDNVATALLVAERFGLPRQIALEAMYAANPDPGALREIIVPEKHQQGSIYFFNALAANDPDSSLVIWNLAREKRNGRGVIIMILRSDRLQRTESYFKCLGKNMDADRYIIAGSPVTIVVNHLKKLNIPDEHIIALESPEHTAMVDALVKFSEGTDVVACAMGNIIGLGEKFINALSTMAKSKKENS